MAILVIDQAPGVNAEQYEAILRQFNLQGTNVPSGQILRLAGPVEGGWRVISVWESREAYDAFRRDRIAPVAQQAGVQDQVQFAPLHSIVIAPQQR
jgi:heme-degrading monooxygenase HmoA